jgi:hypothetical protein
MGKTLAEDGMTRVLRAHTGVLGRSRAEHATLPASLVCLHHARHPRWIASNLWNFRVRFQ